jgi:hypothetical protein
MHGQGSIAQIQAAAGANYPSGNQSETRYLLWGAKNLVAHQSSRQSHTVRNG